MLSGKERESSENAWAELLSRVATQRDKRAFTRLYEDFAGRIRGFLLARGASTAEADELLQACLFQVWDKAGLYNPRLGGVATWIFRIVRNRYVDHLRRQRTQDRVVPEVWLADAMPPPELDQDRARVRQALNQLPSRQAQVLYMSFYQGKSHGEIARELGLPLGSVKSSLRLAFNKLRRCLGEEQ